MKVAKWHPGKIGLLWAGSLVALLALWLGRPARCHSEALWLWAALVTPVAVVTWRWFSSRQAEQNVERRRRWLAVLAWLAWAVAVVYLLALYADCGRAPFIR